MSLASATFLGSLQQMIPSFLFVCLFLLIVDEEGKYDFTADISSVLVAC